MHINMHLNYKRYPIVSLTRIPDPTRVPVDPFINFGLEDIEIRGRYVADVLQLRRSGLYNCVC